MTAAALARCRLTVQVSTKLNRSHVEVGDAAADPAVPRPHRDRPHRRARAARHGRGLDEHRAPVAGRARAGVARTCAARWRSSAGSRARCSPANDTVDWDGFERDYDRIRDRIAARRSPASSDFNERVRQPGGFRLPHRRQRRPVRRPSGRAQLTVNPFDGRRGTAGSAAAADRALARPVQHHDLRPRRPLPRHPPGSAGGVRRTPSTSQRSALPTERSSTS